jgi:hypothetical protein
VTTFNRLGREWHGVADRDLPADLRVGDLPALFDLVDAEGVPVPAGELALDRALTQGAARHGELTIAHPGRPARVVTSSSTPVHDEEGRLLGAVVALSDVTAQRELEAALRAAALHDPLTGLPNRTLLVDRLELALRNGQREPVSMTVLYCDLDGFKLVNDVAGHAVGDEVLVEAARRLRAVVRPPTPWRGSEATSSSSCAPGSARRTSPTGSPPASPRPSARPWPPTATPSTGSG